MTIQFYQYKIDSHEVLGTDSSSGEVAYVVQYHLDPVDNEGEALGLVHAADSYFSEVGVFIHPDIGIVSTAQSTQVGQAYIIAKWFD